MVIAILKCLLLFLITISGSTALQAVDGRLISHWTFDEKSGLVVEDTAGGNIGSLKDFPKENSSWVQGRVNGSLEFIARSRSNEVVIIPDNPSLNFTTNGAFTLAAWVRCTGIPAQSACVISKGYGGGGEQYAIDIQSGIGTFRFFIRNKLGFTFPLVTTVRFSGRWQHVVATYSSRLALMKIYLDGVPTGSRSALKDLQFTVQPLCIGNRQSGTNTGYDLPFSGMIDDVRLYDYALNDGEVKTLYEDFNPLLPIIYSAPENCSRHTSETASFYVIADGTGSLAYQWFKRGILIPGATTSRMQIANVRLEDEGAYTVQVTDAKNASTAATVFLTVKLYYWQTRWFRALAILIGMLLVAAAVRLLERRKANRAFKLLEQRHAVDRERMRIARDMHDEIGGKLSRISFLSEMARRDLPESSKVSRQIDEVSAATQEIIRTVDEIVWAVNPRHDNIYGLVYYIRRHAEEFFELTDIELEFKQPAELPEKHISADMRHHLFSATKEALNNVLKHSRAKKIRISFQCDNKSLGVKIEDDGCGFIVPEDTFNVKVEQACAGCGSGIINTAERMKSIGGEYKLLSHPEKGTVVELTIQSNENKCFHRR